MVSSSSFVEIVQTMIQDTRGNIRQLQECAGDPRLSQARRHTVRDVLHSEGLRLDMLHRALRDYEAG